MKRKLVIALILVCLVALGILAAGPVSKEVKGIEGGYGYGQTKLEQPNQR